jgi:hypothetical protein
MNFLMKYHEGTIYVQADYFKGYKGNREEPPEDDELEIEYVTYNGTDVSDIVDWEVIEEYFWENRERLLNEDY